jgi:hypothetical protein|tara:strand:- start:224 stop:379 length:156 start_codon:yes stop_codon:yes gene_type:complete
MNAEFYETEQIEDALFDLFIDQLHQFAELEDQEDDQSTVWVSSSADRATAF